ncbi:hypothetical protein HZC31_05825 [Candidatus Woesearchaeota archaeon]|nr:hypothetical protein [Candidatus Woesearchaeota archaeon]
MVGQQSLNDIVANRKLILEDILSLWAEGTNEQKAAAIDGFAKLEKPKYRAMMETLERQCDKYEKVVGKEFLEPYELPPKDPTQLRRYFIVLNYIRQISDGNDASRSLVAKRIATMKPEEYSYAIQALKSANEHPNGGDEARELLWDTGRLGFIPVQSAGQQARVYEERRSYDPAAAERARRGREEAFNLLHYDGNK